MVVEDEDSQVSEDETEQGRAVSVEDFGLSSHCSEELWRWLAIGCMI